MVAGQRQFNGRDVWLSPLSFCLCPGEVLLVVGPSGSGKSTLLRTLAHLDPLTEGTLSLDGRPRSEYSAREWRHHVRYFCQKLPFQPGFTDTPEQLANKLSIVGLDQQASIGSVAQQLICEWGLPPDKFTQSWDSLSVGEAHRCALAIVIACDPAVLLLDEPSAALDEQSTLKVERSIKARRGATVIVSHSTSQAERIATRVISLEV